jgi:hypothetical protein
MRHNSFFYAGNVILTFNLQDSVAVENAYFITSIHNLSIDTVDTYNIILHLFGLEGSQKYSLEDSLDFVNLLMVIWSGMIKSAAEPHMCTCI